MDPVEPVDGAEARQGQNIRLCARAICALTESTYSRIRARIVRTRITPNTWESFTTRTRRVPSSAMSCATRSIPSLGSTDTSFVLMISPRETFEGSRPSATTFASRSHSVTMPIGTFAGEVTMTKPWCSRAIVFAASRTEVLGEKDSNSRSTMSFAYRSIPFEGRARHPGVYRIEVDNEVGRFHGDGAPFSFWSSSRVILILSFLLWWIQPAGPMIAGYVGGRRAGSPIKAVIAALMPVFAIYIANITYAHNFASHPADFVAQLPMAVGDAAASILPFLIPYKQFMISYLQGFVQGLATTFGMGTNGYLMVVIFAYIGGLIGEQTRRELSYRTGSGSSVGVNLVQPVIGARPYVDDEEEAYEEDEEIHRSHRPHRPHRARARGRPTIAVEGRHRRRDRGVHSK